MTVVDRSLVGIVGGGPAGIACVAHLKRRGVGDLVLLDKRQHLGGLWACDKTSPIYPGLRTVTSAQTMRFFGESPSTFRDSEFCSGLAVRDFLHRLSDRLGVRDHFQGGVHVTHIEPEGDSWKVSTKNGAAYLFKKIIITTGTEQYPYIPRVWSDLPRALHSSVVSPERIRQAGRTVILGCGTSAGTLASDAAARGDINNPVVLAVPEYGRWVVPTSLDGQPTDLPIALNDPEYLSLKFDEFVDHTTVDLTKFRNRRLPDWPAPDHLPFERGMLVSHDLDQHIESGRVVLAADRERVSSAMGTADLIVVATGYTRRSSSLLPPGITEKLNSVLPPRLVFDGNLGLLQMPNTDLGGFALLEELARLLVDAMLLANPPELGFRPSLPEKNSTFIFGGDLLSTLRTAVRTA